MSTLKVDAAAQKAAEKEAAAAEKAEAERLELQNEKTKGELVEVKQVGEAVTKLFSAIKQKIMGAGLPLAVRDAILLDLSRTRITEDGHVE